MVINPFGENQVITKFGDKMGDNVGDNIIELLNLVTDFSLYSVTNEVIIKFGDEYGDKFDDKLVTNWVITRLGDQRQPLSTSPPPTQSSLISASSVHHRCIISAKLLHYQPIISC